MCRAALQYRLVKEASRRGHAEQGTDAHRASGFAKDGDIVGVSTESLDIVAYPFEGRDLVSDAEIRRRSIVAVADRLPVEKTQRTEAVVDRYNDDVAVSGQSSAVVEGGRTTTENERATMNPDQDRTTCVVAAGRPDIQI